MLTAKGEQRYGDDATLPEHPALPGLVARVRDLFLQIDEG